MPTTPEQFYDVVRTVGAETKDGALTTRAKIVREAWMTKCPKARDTWVGHECSICGAEAMGEPIRPEQHNLIPLLYDGTPRGAALLLGAFCWSVWLHRASGSRGSEFCAWAGRVVTDVELDHVLEVLEGMGE